MHSYTHAHMREKHTTHACAHRSCNTVTRIHTCVQACNSRSSWTAVTPAVSWISRTLSKRRMPTCNRQVSASTYVCMHVYVRLRVFVLLSCTFWEWQTPRQSTSVCIYAFVHVCIHVCAFVWILLLHLREVRHKKIQGMIVFECMWRGIPCVHVYVYACVFLCACVFD